MLMYGGNGVQLLPRFQDKFQALLNEHRNTIEDQIEENTEIPGKIYRFTTYYFTYLLTDYCRVVFSVNKGDIIFASRSQKKFKKFQLSTYFRSISTFLSLSKLA